MKGSDKNKKMALAATVVFHIAVLLILVLSYLHYTDIPMPDDTTQQDITFFGGEYVMLGNALQQPIDNSAATSAADEQRANSGDNSDDAGVMGESATPALSTDEESPMQVTKEAEQAGPTKEELAEQERIRRRKEAEQRTNKLIKGAFNNSSSKGGHGNDGQPDGNSPTGVRSGSPGVSGLSAGYTLEHWGNPSSPVEGTVVIRVRVNSRGQVIAANYNSGSGTAASNMSVRRSCEQASLQSQFKVPTGTVSEAIGYITWRFQ